MLQLDILHRFYFGEGREDYGAEIKAAVGFYCLCIKFKLHILIYVFFFFYQIHDV